MGSKMAAFIAAPVLGFSLMGAEFQDSAAPAAGESVSEVLAALALEPGARTGAFADRGALLQAGFDAFIERMDAFDGPSSVALARALYREDSAIWSGFCLEGALRRSASAGRSTDLEGDMQRLREAESMLEGLRSSQTNPEAAVAVTHRLAILYAGFGLLGEEKRELGAALAYGGIDGAQITGLSALRSGSLGTAASLFASLLDRMPLGDDGTVISGSAIEEGPADAAGADLLLNLSPENAPWALRGHALATLELLRNDSSIPD